MFDPVPAALTVPSLHTHTSIMHSRHILTTKPSVQGNEDVVQSSH